MKTLNSKRFYWLWIGVLAAGLSRTLPAVTYDPALPETLRNFADADFNFVDQIEGNGQTPRHERIYGRVRGSDYQEFFDSRIDKIGYAGNQGPSVAAFVQPFQPHTLWLTDALMTLQAPQAWRIAALWHESRHSEGEHGYWSHVNCPKTLRTIDDKPLVGPLSGASLAGQPACDDTADGAYGITATMLENIALYCSNCSEKIKADAELVFTDGVNRLTARSLRQALLDDADADNDAEN
jgi:hypothetical protein